MSKNASRDGSREGVEGKAEVTGGGVSPGFVKAASSARKELLLQAVGSAVSFLEEMDARGRSVAPTAAALDALSELPAAVPTQGRDAKEVLCEIATVGGPAMHQSGGGRYFGFVTGGALPVSVAADYLVTAWDQNSWSVATSPGAAEFERKAVAGLLSVLGCCFPPSASGALCSGATGANVIALAAARDAVLEAVGWDVASDGLVGAPAIAVYVGDGAHSSVFKALGVVGLGRGGCGKHVRRLDANSRGAVEASSFATLPPPAAPAIVVLQAGHVNTGAFDDFRGVIDWARSGADGGAGVWVHVDGAFGLWAAASARPERRALVRGVEGADSWATDLHKQLNVPYESALVAVRDGRTLHNSMSSAAPYLGASIAGEKRQRQQPLLLPELQNSRRARGVVAWAVLQRLGVDGVAALVDSCCEHAAALAVLLQRGGATLVHPVVFNQALVHFGRNDDEDDGGKDDDDDDDDDDDQMTAEIAAAAQRDGRCWVAATTYKGRTVIRLSVSCWATTSADVEIAARAILECAASVGWTGGRACGR